MNRLGTAHRRLLYLTGTALLVSGALWTVLHYIPGVVGVSRHQARSVAADVLAFHGATAMVALILLGTLLSHHIGAGWAGGLNRGTGISTGAICSVLAVTGYLLYYAGNDILRAYVSWIHIAGGALLPAVVARHARRLACIGAPIRGERRSTIRTDRGERGGPPPARSGEGA